MASEMGTSNSKALLRARPTPQPASDMHLTPMYLALDFDGTVTERDTMSAFAGACRRFQISRGRTDLPPWTHFGQAYMKDYEAHENQYRPRRHHRTTIAEEVAWLESLKPTEQVSHKRVRDSGLFEGDLDETKPWFDKHASGSMQEVKIRSGWWDLLWRMLKVERENGKVIRLEPIIKIVSVNWSRLWVHLATLYESDVSHSWLVGDAFEKVLNAKVYYAIGESLNVRRPFSDFCGPEAPHATSHDKLRAYIKRAVHASVDSSTISRGLRVYAGDSATDLECLLAADLPMIMRDEPMRSGQKELADTLQRLGIATKALADFDAEDLQDLKSRLLLDWPPTEGDPVADDARLEDNIRDRHKVLYTVSNFHSLVSWINEWHAKLDV